MPSPSLLQTLLHTTDFTRPPHPPPRSLTPDTTDDCPNPVRPFHDHDRDHEGETTRPLPETDDVEEEQSLPGSFLSTLLPCAATSFAIQTLFGIPSVIYQTEKVYDLAGGVGFYTTLATSFVVPVLRRRERERLVAEARAGLEDTKEDAKEYKWRTLCLKKDWDWRQISITASTFVWAFRISTYLFTRVLRRGHDSRFNRTRSIPRLFAILWFGQAIWVIFVCMPAIAVNSIPLESLQTLSRQAQPQDSAAADRCKAASKGGVDEAGSKQEARKKYCAVTATEKLGMILFLFGFAVENLADYQKSKWWQEKRRKLHNEDFLTRGLWARSQYPNYFGEITLQLGSFLFASGILSRKPVQRAIGWQTSNSGYIEKLSGTLKAVLIPVLAPAFTTLALLKLSGIPLSQRKYDRRYGDREEYRRWRKDTPLLVPRLLRLGDYYPLPL